MRVMRPVKLLESFTNVNLQKTKPQVRTDSRGGDDEVANERRISLGSIKRVRLSLTIATTPLT